MTGLARLLGALAFVILGAGAGRDAIDRWVDGTVLPPLVTEQSVEVVDRNGDLLRAFTVADGRWRMAVNPSDVDPTYLAMLVRYEDKRFYDHAGIDLVAMTRAVLQAIRHGRVVSGGSTLTMQVARLLEDGPTGTWSGKLRQIRVALALERTLSKDEILAIYLNRAPFGGNVEGVKAASFVYFDKPPARLTVAEAALLVGLPQSPERRRPDRNPQASRMARDSVLERLADTGLIDRQTEQAALTESLPSVRRDVPAFAAHLADRVRASDPAARRHEVTIDRALQIRLENLAARSVAGRSDHLQIAIMVADHQTGEILASVGSAGYEADRSAGFVDFTQAVRSPGSTLKPLIYGLAFDQGLVHPETLIADSPVNFDGYAPQNFDGLYRGEVRVRTALQLSLNIPVVSLTDAMGPQHLISGLRRAGAKPDVPGGIPGLAVALGGVGLTLEDLMRLYGGIAHGGVRVDLRTHLRPTEGFAPTRIMSDISAWEIADILLEVPRPRGVTGTGIAFKTGTSYGHRDAWSIGFDGRHVVGVWMGRADGTPVPGAFGGELAAPVMFDAFARLKREIDPISAPPPATLLVSTAQLPVPLQRFRPRGEVIAQTGPRISFPPDGATLEGDALVAKVRDGAPPFTWLANGQAILTSRDREVVFPDLGRGFSELTVLDSTGKSAAVRFELRN